MDYLWPQTKHVVRSWYTTGIPQTAEGPSSPAQQAAQPVPVASAQEPANPQGASEGIAAPSSPKVPRPATDDQEGGLGGVSNVSPLSMARVELPDHASDGATLVSEINDEVKVPSDETAKP